MGWQIEILKPFIPTESSTLLSDLAIAQTQRQQPQQPMPVASPPPSDPLTVWGIAVALLLSVGQVAVSIFKGYAAHIGRKSEIELKAQESREQGDQAMSLAILEQQKTFVAYLQESQANSTKQIMDLLHEATKAQLETAHAIKELTEEIRAKK